MGLSDLSCLESRRHEESDHRPVPTSSNLARFRIRVAERSLTADSNTVESPYGRDVW